MNERLTHQKVGSWRLDNDLKTVCEGYLKDAEAIIAEAETMPSLQQEAFVRYELAAQGYDSDEILAQFAVDKGEESV